MPQRAARPDALPSSGQHEESLLAPWASRLLTAALVLSALGFVVVTVGSSLVGSTSFYGGGLLVNNKPWIGEGYGPVEVTNNYVGDTVDTVIPSRAQIVDRAYAGEWAGWSPLQGAGAELASVPSYGLLAPTGLAWWVLPHSLAPGWEKLTVLVLATAGTALFLRRLSVRRHAAWLGGMIYAGSGFMMAWTNWPHAGVAAMLPWLFWAAERALQLRTWRATAPVSLALGFLLLGGFPAVTGLGLYAAAGYVVLRSINRHRDGDSWRTVLADVGRLTAALVTGILLAGIQLIVFAYDFAGLDTSYRADAFHKILPLKMALTSVFPNVWGQLGGGPFDINPIESNAYLGVAGVVLVAVALLLRPARTVPRGVRTYFAAIVVVSFLLIYVQGPLLDWVGGLPVFSGNGIGRLISVTLLAAAVLAGLGFDAVLRHAGRRTTGSTVRLAVGLLAAVGGLVAFGVWAYLRTRIVLDPGAQQAIVGTALAGALVVAAAVAVAFWRPSWRGIVLATVPVVVVVQGASAAATAWAQVPRQDFYPVTAVHQFLLAQQGSDRMAVAGATMANGTTAYYGLRSATGHVFTSPEFGQLQRAICQPCLASATYWVLPGSTDLPLWQSPGLDRMGVRYLTADPESVIPGTEEPIVRGTRELPLPDRRAPLTVSVPGGPLRGVLLDFRSGPAQGSLGHLAAEVVDANGKVLLSTRRLVQFPRPAVPLYVPMAGETLPSGGSFTVRLWWDGATAPPVLAGNDTGRPAFTAIRPADDGLRLVYAREAVVWERLSALPRVRWASRADVIPSGPARVAALTGAGVPAGTVVLDGFGGATDGAPADVQVLEDSGDVVRARVDAQGAGYLVLADDIQADWTVTVNGREQPIVPADHAFGAVHLPKGVSDVTFSYTPRGGTAGLVVSGVGLLLLLLMLAPPVRRRRGRPASAAAGSPPVDAPHQEPHPAPMVG